MNLLLNTSPGRRAKAKVSPGPGRLRPQGAGWQPPRFCLCLYHSHLSPWVSPLSSDVPLLWTQGVLDEGWALIPKEFAWTNYIHSNHIPRAGHTQRRQELGLQYIFQESQHILAIFWHKLRECIGTNLVAVRCGAANLCSQNSRGWSMRVTASLRPAWVMLWVQDQPKPQNETLSQNTKNQKKGINMVLSFPWLPGHSTHFYWATFLFLEPHCLD